MMTGDQIPFLTTSLDPLVRVTPAMAAVASFARLSTLDRANQYAALTMWDLEDIPERNGIQIIRDVMDLEPGIKWDVVLRRMTNSFWSE
jgi:hypothetical protein